MLPPENRSGMEKWMKIFAGLVALVLSPLTLWPMMFWHSIETQNLTAVEKLWAKLIIFGIGITPAIIALVYLKLTGKVSDWQLKKRTERYRFNIIVLAWAILMLVFLHLFGFTLLFKWVSVVVIWFALFTLITFFWKISAHVATVTLVFLMLSGSMTAFIRQGLPWVVLVSWVRVYLKNHTPGQVFGGFVLSFVVFWVSDMQNWL